MKLKYVGIYNYDENKSFPIYQDSKNRKFLEKTTDILNYENLRKIAEIAIDNDFLLSIVAFYKKQDGKIGYLTPLLKGETLEELVEKKVKFKSEELMEFIYQLCLGIRDLHNGEIIHRDIKPTNIMSVAKDKIRLIDYDISRGYDFTKTNDTTILGTHGYAAPEQYGFYQTSIQSDIYSLGKTIEYMVNNLLVDDGYIFNHIIKKACEMDITKRFSRVDEIINYINKTNGSFFEAQLLQIKNGHELGLTKEEVAIYADIKYNAKQMGVIKHALVSKLGDDCLKLLLNPEFSSRQMWQIKEGFLNKIEFQSIRLYAKPYYKPEEMGIFRSGMLHKKSISTIYNNIMFYNNVMKTMYLSAMQLAKIRFGFFSGLDSIELRSIANEVLSVESMEKMIDILLQNKEEYDEKK